MRVLEGEQILVRIYVGEFDKWHNQPLSAALIDRLRREGFAGTTVVRGVAGFGARSVAHAENPTRLSVDLPVLVEVVDEAQQIERIKPILDEMISEGLVTMQHVTVLKYAPGSRPNTRVPPPITPGTAT